MKAKFWLPYSFLGLLVSGLTVFGCSDSQFSSGGFGNESKKSDREESSAESERPAGNPDVEDEEANEPVQISGAFLTCEMTTAKGDAAASMSVGCTVKAQDGAPIDIAAVKATFVVENNAGEDIGCVFTGPKDNYHATTDIPLDVLESVTVTVKVEYDGQVVVLKSSVKEKDHVGDPLPPPPPPSATPDPSVFGTFRIGDGKSSLLDNAGCSQAQEQSQEVIGKKLFIPFKVSSISAKITIELSGVCGLDDDDSYLRVTGENFFMKDRKISTKSPSTTIPSIELKKGTYRFEVHSESLVGNYDDFTIGKVLFKVDGGVVFGEPSGFE